MTIWMVLALAFAFLATALVLRRGTRHVVLASVPVTTMHLAMSRRDARKRAALAAADAMLR